MFKQFAIASLITLCSLLPAHAENWVHTGNTEGNHIPHYLDTDSIQGSNGYYRYWISFAVPEKKLIFSVYKSIACRERMQRAIVIRQYTRSGNLISSYNYGNTQKPRPILAGSMGSLEWETICR